MELEELTLIELREKAKDEGIIVEAASLLGISNLFFKLPLI